MWTGNKWLALLGFSIAFLGPAGYGATVTGTVKGPDGAPFKAAFVQAQNVKSHITTYVLSDDQGRYQVDKLPAGEYRVQAQATGYRSDAKGGVTLTAEQSTSVDFAFQKSMVRWSELSNYQGVKLLPAAKGKDTLFSNCMVCHGFQSRMASVRRDEDGWQDRVSYMRDIVHFSLANGGHFTDEKASDVVSYLSNVFGPNSTLPKSPEQLPEYHETLRPLSNEGKNIVYVEYDLPGMNRLPFSAAPDKNGYLWVPNFGPANKITRVDPRTGEFRDFPTPTVHNAAIHSAYPAPDGSVWLGEQATNKIGRWDPTTEKITEYQDAMLPGKEGTTDGGCKHTIRFDPDGNVWSSGDPLSRFDPETGKFTDFWKEVGSTYAVTNGIDGNMWFTTLGTNRIGKIDYKTLKVSMWDSPTANSFPRRLEVDSDGMVWFGEFNAGKITSFDPKTETFKEYQLPGPAPSPYALGIDKDHNIWYSSYSMDVIGHLDTKTGKVTEYPYPHAENTMREFLHDSQGRMWYGSPANSKIGYFYLTGDSGAIASSR